MGAGYFERGRLPLLVNTGSSALLAALTLVRFAVLVAVLSPHDYGTLNVFVTMTNVLPALLSLGFAWQVQRVAHDEGPQAIDGMLRTGLAWNLTMFVPVLILAFGLGLPFAPPGDAAVLAIATVAISAAGSVAALVSQINLGLGNRSESAFVMLLVNGGVTAAVLPLVVFGGGVSTLLLLWALLAVAGALVGVRLLRRHAVGVPQTRVRLSKREGFMSIPALVGPWVFLFALRYALGLTMSPTDLASFAISSTIADMAFLIAAAVVNVRSSYVLGGEDPNRSLRLAIPVLLGLTALGTAVITVVVPLLAKDGYVVSIGTTAALAVACVFRLHFNAWRSRTVRLQRVHLTARAFLVVAVVVPLVLVLVQASHTVLYGAAAAVGFALIAGYQRYVVAH